MSTQELPKCCVCGQPTTKRCQACAKSGIDLFFCSPEHQKLVWKHHKQVCGPNADPFCPRALTDEEACALLTHAREARTVSLDAFPPSLLSALPRHGAAMQQLGAIAAKGSVTIADLMENYAGGPPGSFETRILPNLRNPVDIPRRSRYTGLTKARSFLLQHLEGFVGGTGDVYVHTIWAQVARLGAFAGGWLGTADNDAEMRLLSQINHHLLILVTLARIKHADDSAIPDAWILRSFEHVVDLHADIKPFESIQALHYMTNHYRSRTATLADRSYIAVPKPGGRGPTLRYPD